MQYILGLVSSLKRNYKAISVDIYKSFSSKMTLSSGSIDGLNRALRVTLIAVTIYLVLNF